MFAERHCPAICAFRSVMAYISAAQRIGGDLIAGYLFPVVTAEDGVSLSAARMTANLQSDLRMAESPDHFMMRVGGRTLARATTVSRIRKLFCCVCVQKRTESMLKKFW